MRRSVQQRLATRFVPTGDIAAETTLLPRLMGMLRRGNMYRDGYSLIFSAVATSAIGIVYWALAARLYPTRFVGLNSAAISSMLLFSGVAQLNLMSALIRFTPRAGRATAKLILSVYLATMTAGIAVALVLLLLRGVWTPVPGLFDNGAPFFWWFLLSTIAWGIFALQDYVLTGLQQAIWVPVENVVFAMVKIVMLVALVRFQEYGIFFSWTIPTLAAILVMNILILTRLVPARMRVARHEPEKITPRQLARFVVPDYLGSLCALASTALLPILVTRQVGASAAAYFYPAFLFAWSVHLVALNFGASFTVEAAMDTARLQVLVRTALWHTARLVLPLVVLVCLAAPIILQVFGPGYSGNGTTALRLMTLGAVPNLVTVLYVGIARVRRSTGRIFAVQGCLCILVLGSSHFLLGVYGVAGVGLGWLISQTLVALFLAATELRPLFRPAVRIPADGAAGQLEAKS